MKHNMKQKNKGQNSSFPTLSAAPKDDEKEVQRLIELDERAETVNLKSFVTPEYLALSKLSKTTLSQKQAELNRELQEFESKSESRLSETHRAEKYDIKMKLHMIELILADPELDENVVPVAYEDEDEDEDGDGDETIQTPFKKTWTKTSGNPDFREPLLSSSTSPSDKIKTSKSPKPRRVVEESGLSPAGTPLYFPKIRRFEKTVTPQEREREKGIEQIIDRQITEVKSKMVSAGYEEAMSYIDWEESLEAIVDQIASLGLETFRGSKTWQYIFHIAMVLAVYVFEPGFEAANTITGIGLDPETYELQTDIFDLSTNSTVDNINFTKILITFILFWHALAMNIFSIDPKKDSEEIVNPPQVKTGLKMKNTGFKNETDMQLFIKNMAYYQLEKPLSSFVRLINKGFAIVNYGGFIFVNIAGGAINAMPYVWAIQVSKQSRKLLPLSLTITAGSILSGLSFYAGLTLVQLIKISLEGFSSRNKMIQALSICPSQWFLNLLGFLLNCGLRGLGIPGAVFYLYLFMDLEDYSIWDTLLLAQIPLTILTILNTASTRMLKNFQQITSLLTFTDPFGREYFVGDIKALDFKGTMRDSAWTIAQQHFSAYDRRKLIAKSVSMGIAYGFIPAILMLRCNVATIYSLPSSAAFGVVIALLTYRGGKFLLNAHRAKKLILEMCGRLPGSVSKEIERAIQDLLDSDFLTRLIGRNGAILTFLAVALGNIDDEDYPIRLLATIVAFLSALPEREFYEGQMEDNLPEALDSISKSKNLIAKLLVALTPCYFSKERADSCWRKGWVGLRDGIDKFQDAAAIRLFGCGKKAPNELKVADFLDTEMKVMQGGVVVTAPPKKKEPPTSLATNHSALTGGDLHAWAKPYLDDKDSRRLSTVSGVIKRLEQQKALGATLSPSVEQELMRTKRELEKILARAQKTSEAIERAKTNGQASVDLGLGQYRNA
jgi:hypothetical protein